MIPPGVHFMSYNSVSKRSGDKSPKTGFFHLFKRSEIVLKQWCNETEEVIDKLISLEDMEYLKQNLQNLDSSLGAYPYEIYRKWVSMSSAISDRVLDKLCPVGSMINSVAHLISSPGGGNEPGCSKFGKIGEDGLPVMETNPNSVIHFTKLPKQWYPEGCTSEEKTKHSMDSSFALEMVLQTFTEPIDLLGELQYTFVCFVLGQVLDAFEHWRQLVKILCNCDQNLPKYVPLYMELIAILYHQLGEISPDFFVDIVSSNNFLVTHLTTLFENIKNISGNQELKVVANKFRKHLSKRYKWKFNEEPADWAPVIVDI